MIKLENKVFLTNIFPDIDELEKEFIDFVLSDSKINKTLITSYKKLYAGFFNSIYQLNLKFESNNYSLFIISSIHDGYFTNDKKISSISIKNKIQPASPKLICSGKYLDKINYAAFINPNSFLFTNILTDNIDIFSKQLGFILQYFYKNSKNFSFKKFKNNRSHSKSFFDLCSFYKYEDKNKINSFLKFNKKIDGDIFFSFYKDAYSYFESEVLNNLSDIEDIVCLGFKFPQDIIFDNKNYCPLFISNFNMYKGDPALDMLFFSRILNINDKIFVESFKDCKESYFKRFKKTYDCSWIISLAYIYFNKLLKEFYSFPAHNFNSLDSERVYLENRARMKNHPLFSKYVKSFNHFFIEK